MNRGRGILIAVCFLAAFAMSGVFTMLGCDCHADGCGADDLGCACVCVAHGGAASTADGSTACVSYIDMASALHPDDMDPCGRLAESFIFTPPRT